MRPKPHPPASRVTLSRRRKRGQTLSSEVNARETDSSLRRDGSVPIQPRSSPAHVRHSGTQPPPGLEPHQSRRGIGGLREEVWPSLSPASTSSQPRPSQEMACPNRLLPLEDPRQKVSPMCTRGMNFLTWAPSPSGRKSYPRRKSHPMCTRGAHFLAAVRPRGSSLPRTPPRVYTRGGLSVIGPVSRQSDLPSLSENASRVYTRVAFSDAGPLGTLPTSSSGPLRSRRGIHWLRMERATAFRASQPLHVRRIAIPPPRALPCRGGPPSRIGGLPRSARWQQTPDVSTHSGK